MKIWNLFGKLFSKQKPHSNNPIKNVAIFGYADAPDKSELFQSVVAVSKKLAESGFTVVDGGGPGVMRAATIGAKSGGGKVIGVTLEIEDIPNFEGRDSRNLFDVEIKTKSYVERTLMLMKEGQVYVIFNGGTGTISEFGMAWGLARLYFGHHKPLILYGRFWVDIIKSFKDNMLLRPEELRVYKIVETPEQVLLAIREFENELSRGEHTHLEPSQENGYTV
ncbi:hypothetical protein A3H85_02605 [Candidatus Daviesbacteria bacterium RIFCSPLOWO2_02_FULL_40_8]|uniref:LOG family protein n=1 Tax=Candidatus Daviesbacteria bacterium RIFCSPLOWO2_01_FULL_40_24 TaxID=1797787 RepID=A0A1F5MIH9_9BACT|nr:MAG: hypothetical protein A2780_03335 [Candidatus Daviesbacteria bacterium RIFCSPHIGHO2_01_FULL_41_45]OGE34181.1 MAG: hypothetical protein A3C32_00420 [Candidatus Daviesbacteria bacterium RIFCSPHIGHO2_02_FULL_41_14]OGE65165.1 MAG: hypothetical protein A3B49_01370 [Candidatus Daviesbacteria bacterium RIFCSPLOWO2_01_FULL_40_24]OGE66868.1 MAG: hypothetical protein A3H85_02605 [Candidatus Daviesbacteria bacterium RIFCSPLOWO2_02_FULL_40_8]